MPFLYYYDCGSKLLSTFIPTWIYYFAIYIILSFLSTLLSFLFQIFGKLKYQVCELKTSLLLHLCLLICYGVHFPLLCLILVFVMIVDYFLQAIPLVSSAGISLISQSYESTANPIPNTVLTDSEHNSEEIASVFRNEEDDNKNRFELSQFGQWFCISCILIFHSIILFDMVGDEMGYEIAFFIPIIFLVLIVMFALVLLVSRICLCQGRKPNQNEYEMVEITY